MINYKEKIEESEIKGKNLLITFYGEINIEDISQIKTLLLESFAIQNRVVLDVGDITISDFSFLQILCATNKYAQLNEKHFELRNHRHALFLKNAQTLGFSRQHGCAESQHPHRCLWLDTNVLT